MNPKEQSNLFFWTLVITGTWTVIVLFGGAAHWIKMAFEWAFETCRTTLGHLGAPGYIGDAILFGILVLCIASITMFGASLFADFARFRRMFKSLGPTIHHERTNKIARIAGLDQIVQVFDSEDMTSFTYGWSNAKVAITSGLVDRLNDEALLSVLLHEAHHVTVRDPVKLSLVRAFAKALFFLPAAAPLAVAYYSSSEISADRHAIRHTGSASGLIASLATMAGIDTRQPSTSVPGIDSLLEVRLICLLHNEVDPSLPGPSPLWTAVSVSVVAVLTSAVFILGHIP